MLSGSREVQASGPVKEDTVIGPKIAAVERREARAPVTRHAAPPKVPDLRRSAFRRSAPLTFVRERPLVGEGMEIPALPAPCENRGGGALGFVRRLFEM